MAKRKLNFEIPDSASTVAGAAFFAQHLNDLTWGVGQQLLTNQVEELVSMILDGVERSRDSEVWGRSYWTEQGAPSADDAIRMAQGYFNSRASYAKEVNESNAQTSIEASLCRYVDNFLCYLSDLLRLIFNKYPNALASNEASIAVRDIFAYPSLDALLTGLAERTITDLSFKGFGEIEAYYKRRFNFELVADASIRQEIAFAIACRNLIVHRRGLIDERFLKMTETVGTIGSRINVRKRVWHQLIPSILDTVRDIDARAALKFEFPAAMVLPTRNEP